MTREARIGKVAEIGRREKSPKTKFLLEIEPSQET